MPIAMRLPSVQIKAKWRLKSLATNDELSEKVRIHNCFFDLKYPGHVYIVYFYFNSFLTVFKSYIRGTQ